MSILVLSLMVFADAGVDAAALKKFEGKWVAVDGEHGGEKTPKKELLGWSLEVTGAKWLTRDGTETRDEMTVVSLDAKEKPAAADFKITSAMDKDKVLKAIWKLDGDKLTLCIAEPGKDRPKAFEGKKGTGHRLLVFERYKEKK